VKTRPCKKACGYPALKGRQFCQWHALMRSSSDEQAAAALDRREDYLGHDFASYVAQVPKDRWPDGERWCAGCQSFVPLFYCSGSRCKACTSAASHARRLEDNYGIDSEEYVRIFRLQGGKCAICRNTPRTIRFAVDHDHKTGAVRGILCKRCNHDLLGGGHDDVLTLWRAVEYLLFPPATTPVRASQEDVLAALKARLDLRDLLAAPRAAQGCTEPPPF
jgi:hypothetical protein